MKSILCVLICVMSVRGQILGRNITTCISTQYYDSITLTCQNCKDN